MEYGGDFTIADVADLLGIRRLAGGTAEIFGAECPFCGDTRGKCNFCVAKDGEIKNVFHCYNCDAGGNMLTLYADLTGLTGGDRYKEAYRQIRERLGSSYSAIQLYHGSRRAGTPQLYHETRRMPEKGTMQKRREPVPDASHLDAVYRRMLTLLQLSERHKDDLRRRGLTETEIIAMEVAGYRSTQSGDSLRIARKLLTDGFSLKGVPGFFVNRNGDWETAFYPANAGYLCPVWSADLKLAGFQIRLDQPYQKRKYIWFTSSGLEGGTSSKSPAGLSGELKGTVIRVTEGILKAEIAYQKTGLACIGNPGVSNYKGLRHMLEALKQQGLETVLECYDMDKMLSLACEQDYDGCCSQCEFRSGVFQGFECPKKRQKRDSIRKGCLKLYEICRELGLKCCRMEWDVDENGIWKGNYKGIDDWLTKEQDNSERSQGKELRGKLRAAA